MDAHLVAVSDLQLFLIICVDQLDQGKNGWAMLEPMMTEFIWLSGSMWNIHYMVKMVYSRLSHPCGSSLNCLEYTTV